jgi:uncharacterized membrane protein
MKIDWRLEIPALSLLTGMLALALATWPGAPDRIPVHWNFAGDVDRYGGRFEGLLLPPLLTLFVYLAMLLLPRVDPGRANYASFWGRYAALRFAVVALIATFCAVTHLTLRGYAVSMGVVAPFAVGLLFVAFGGILGKIRPNWFVGIRTPWTLSSKLAWDRTHRLGGYLFLACGLGLMLLTAVAPRLMPYWFVGSVAATTLTLVLYSYLVWRADPAKLPAAGVLPAGEDGDTAR